MPLAEIVLSMGGQDWLGKNPLGPATAPLSAGMLPSREKRAVTFCLFLVAVTLAFYNPSP